MCHKTLRILSLNTKELQEIKQFLFLYKFGLKFVSLHQQNFVFISF
jgi:hypothetical protein